MFLCAPPSHTELHTVMGNTNTGYLCQLSGWPMGHKCDFLLIHQPQLLKGRCFGNVEWQMLHGVWWKIMMSVKSSENSSKKKSYNSNYTSISYHFLFSELHSSPLWLLSISSHTGWFQTRCDRIEKETCCISRKHPVATCWHWLYCLVVSGCVLWHERNGTDYISCFIVRWNSFSCCSIFKILSNWDPPCGVCLKSWHVRNEWCLL